MEIKNDGLYDRSCSIQESRQTPSEAMNVSEALAVVALVCVMVSLLVLAQSPTRATLRIARQRQRTWANRTSQHELDGLSEACCYVKFYGKDNSHIKYLSAPTKGSDEPL
jgi:hypothetical protein